VAASLRKVAPPRVAPPRFAIPNPPGWFGPVQPGAAVMVAALLLAPLFLSTYWAFSFAVGLVFAIACLGTMVLVGWAGQISLMHAGVVGSALYLSFATTTQMYDRAVNQARTEAGLRFAGHPPQDAFPGSGPYRLIGAAVGIGFAVVACAAVGLLVRRLAAMYVVTLTFAVQFAIESDVFTQDRLTGGLTNWSMSRPEPFGISLATDRAYCYFIAVVLLAVAYVLHRLRRSRCGRSIVFVGHDPEAAATVGISPWRYRLVAWLIAGLCAGISGVLQGPLYQGQPSSLYFISVNSVLYVAVIMIAGSTSSLAVIVVAVALQIIPQILQDWQINIYLLGGVGMAIGVMLGPRGVGGVVIDLFTRHHRRGVTQL
jgi:branched-chain amino acid transport system permease protein